MVAETCIVSETEFNPQGQRVDSNRLGVTLTRMQMNCRSQWFEASPSPASLEAALSLTLTSEEKILSSPMAEKQNNLAMPSTLIN